MGSRGSLLRALSRRSELPDQTGDASFVTSERDHMRRVRTWREWEGAATADAFNIRYSASFETNVQDSEE